MIFGSNQKNKNFLFLNTEVQMYNITFFYHYIFTLHVYITVHTFIIIYYSLNRSTLTLCEHVLSVK
jgi:hypothetical protein